jgi:hypothetical protein
MRHATCAILVCLLAVVGAAAPPTLTVPADKLKPVAGYVRFTPDTTAKAVTYVPLDDAYPFPSEELRDGRRFVLPVAGLKDGRYRFVAVGTLNDEQTATAFEVVIGGGAVDDKKDDGTPKPPPGKVSNLRLAVVSESSALTGRKAEFYADKPLADYWASRKWDGVWWIDPQVKDPATGQMPAKWKLYADRAASLKLADAVFLVDRDTGEILYEGAPPKTPADLLQLIKTKTGG